MLTLKEAADEVRRRLQVETLSLSTFRNWVRKGKLKGFKVGGRLMFRLSDIRVFLKKPA
jgi:predicted site-specific integrase-resolvase